MFKKRRGIHLPYNKQGLIYFQCMNFKEQPETIQQKIKSLCIEVAGRDWKALYEIVTNDHKSIVGISMDYYINEKTLYRYRKEFYEKW